MILDNTVTPLHIEMARRHERDFLIYLKCGDNAKKDMDYKNRVLTITRGKLKTSTIAAASGFERHAVSRYIKTYTDEIYQGCIAMLNTKELDRLLDESANKAAATRNLLTRIYCYCVCKCWEHPMAALPILTISKDLGICNNAPCWPLHWLVNHNFLYVKQMQCNFAGQEGHSRIYQLYEDAVPFAYRKMKWWRGKLQKKPNTAMEPPDDATAAAELEQILRDYSCPWGNLQN